MAASTLEHPRIVSENEWLIARKELLQREKELTRLRDQISAQRRALPWVRVEKQYEFDGPGGKVTLADLFDGRSQLIVKHFMFGPDEEHGCVGCSFHSDHIDGARIHLEHHDVSLVAVSRAPFSKLDTFRRRMGWGFKWVSSADTTFNYDYHVSFTKDEIAAGEVNYNYSMVEIPIEDLHGISVFYKDTAGDVFHTYSSYARGNEEMFGAYVYLDLTPIGRNENGPTHSLADWVRHHDRYDAAGFVDPTGRWHPSNSKCC
jgi:predicted dithiol-disulfide oxidoreductase (DUF899 family)